MDIQWYPGHMTKTRRQIQADLKLVDLVVEVVDARIPRSSRNPDIDALVGEKPRIIMLNRADQADPQMNRAWVQHFNKSQGIPAAAVDARSGDGVGQMAALARNALKEQMAKWREKGQVGRPIRAMVVGVPNVGKSTFINKVAGRKSAKAGDHPGVTRGKQWVGAGSGLDLLDTPGILWPKFEDPKTGLHLAFTGAVKDEVMDAETLACGLAELLDRRYPQALVERYKVPPEAGEPGYVRLEQCARKRGFLISGGEVDTERMAKILLDEFRGGKLGRFTLESPEGEGEHGCE
ncbi:MAG: ribosome biogenesis GTPase YlqF [Flavonifractor sp.]|nr:ribosome biogenesis GTPase YlqF [Flavonifractor sp.]